MKELWIVADFLRRMRIRMRFGKFSRAPLSLLRFQLQGDFVRCDFLARPADDWDATLPSCVGERNATMQALLDAIGLRELLLDMFPEVQSAELRLYRQSAREPPRLIITGTVTREAPAVQKVTSPVMRAKLYGFRFSMNDGVLEPQQMIEEPGLEMDEQQTTLTGSRR